MGGITLGGLFFIHTNSKVNTIGISGISEKEKLQKKLEELDSVYVIPEYLDKLNDNGNNSKVVDDLSNDIGNNSEVLDNLSNNIEESSSNEMPKIYANITKSEEFEAWDNLPDEIKNKTLEPAYNTISAQNSMRRSNYYLLTNEESNLYASLPSSYNIKSKISNIKDQAYTGTCWAFASSSAIESSLFIQHDISKQFSPMHINYRTSKSYFSDMFDRDLQGGHYIVSLAYYVDGFGPVYESDFPFSTYYDLSASPSYVKQNVPQSEITGKAVHATVTDITKFGSVKKETSGGSLNVSGVSSMDELTAIRNSIKTHIKVVLW